MALDVAAIEEALREQLSADYAVLATATVDSTEELAKKLASAIASKVVARVQDQLTSMIATFNSHTHASAAPGSPTTPTATPMS